MRTRDLKPAVIRGGVTLMAAMAALALVAVPAALADDAAAKDVTAVTETQETGANLRSRFIAAYRAANPEQKARLDRLRTEIQALPREERLSRFQAFVADNPDLFAGVAENNGSVLDGLRARFRAN